MRLRNRDPRIADELRFHRDRLIDDYVASGMDRREAERRARLELGNPLQIEEACRDARGRVIQDLIQDVRYTLRILGRAPGFAVVAILSLALGIGANTAMFQLLDAVRLRDLPVRSPGELFSVRIGGSGPSGNFTSRYSDLSAAQWGQIERSQQAFSTIAAWSPRRVNLADGGEVRPAEGMFVSGAFFEVLGISASHGRLLGRPDDRPGCGSPAAVVSHAFWRRELRGSRDAIGARIRVDGHTVEIVGVTPERFYGVEVGRAYDIAVPLCAEALIAGPDSQLTEGRHNYWLSAIGRLRGGWTDAQANAHLRAISAQVFAATVPADRTGEDAERYTTMWLHAVPAGKGVSWLRVDYERSLWLLLGSAGVVLLIVCGNLASLLLARASARTQEISVRLALGASRGRLIRQLLTESLLLALAGAALGLAIARSASAALVSVLVTADNPVALDTAVDWRTLSFSAAVALVTCAAFGLIPALRAAMSMRSSSRSVAGSADRSAIARALVVAQVTLCIVLMAGALLFGRSLYNLLVSDLGFEHEAVLVASIDTRRLGFDDERQKVLFGTALDRLRAAPGVVAAAQSNIVPMSGWESRIGLTLDDSRRISTRISTVTSGYFETLGTAVVAGRDFGPLDGERAEPVAIVNEAFARTFLSGAPPVGRTFAIESNRTVRIVGLVKDTKYRAIREEFRPIVFFPVAQVPTTANYARYVVRSTLPPLDAAAAVRGAVASLSPSIDVELVPLSTQIRQSIVRERLLAALGGGFGGLAGLLAALGIYGLLSYSVESRRHEMGIRLALGADRRMLVGLVVREAGWLLGLGAATGLAIAVAAGRTTASLLHGLQPHDPLTLASTALVLIGIGMASAYVPARRAAAIDPLEALKRE